MTEQEIIENIKRCPIFDRCNKNLCPLDYKLNLRVGQTSDKCRYMRRDRTKDSIMLNELLKFVPKNNISKLNASSQKRYYKLYS